MYTCIILDVYKAIRFEETSFLSVKRNQEQSILRHKWDINDRSKADEWRKYVDELNRQKSHTIHPAYNLTYIQAVTKER